MTHSPSSRLPLSLLVVDVDDTSSSSSSSSSWSLLYFDLMIGSHTNVTARIVTVTTSSALPSLSASDTDTVSDGEGGGVR